MTGDLEPEQICVLLRGALQAEISETDLPDLWPHVPSDPYLASIRSDLAFALAHIPGTGDPWRPVLATWRQMPEFDELTTHLANLQGLSRESI